MSSAARLPSPTLRVEEGDHVAITLYNTHYLPHTIHLHGTSQPNDMDGVPHMTQHEVRAGQVVHLSLHRRRARHLLVSLPRAGPRPSADGARRHADHRAEPAAQSLRASRFRAPAASPRWRRRRARNTRANIRSCTWTSTTGSTASRPPTPIRARSRSACIATTTRRSASPTSSCSTAARFPFTMRDTPIVVKPDETTKLRVLNVGARTVYLHTHGHHPTLTDLDGRAGARRARASPATPSTSARRSASISRCAPAATACYAAGPGVWLMHDHAQPAASNKGINPGGDHTAIVYEGFHGRRRPADRPDDHPGHSAHARLFRSGLLPGQGAGVRSEDLRHHRRNLRAGLARRRRRPAAPFDYPRRDAAAGAAAARPDRRRAPPAGRDVLRGAAARANAASW